MLPYRDSRITQFALVLFFLLLAGYAYYEARGLLFGPSITVNTNTSEVTSAFIVIAGHADRISALAMNGNPVDVTEDGSFSQPYLLAPGYNRITLDATDKYGRKSSKVLEIVYTPPGSATTTAAENGTATTTLSASTTSGMLPTSTVPVGGTTSVPSTP